METGQIYKLLTRNLRHFEFIAEITLADLPSNAPR